MESKIFLAAAIILAALMGLLAGGIGFAELIYDVLFADGWGVLKRLAVFGILAAIILALVVAAFCIG